MWDFTMPQPLIFTYINFHSNKSIQPVTNCPYGILGAVTEEKSSKLDIESVSSDTDFQREQTVDLEAGKGNSTEFVDGDIMVKGIQCSVITDAGAIENVEIYDYSERGT